MSNLDPIKRFVRRNRLHACTPVSLQAIYLLVDIRRLPLSSATMGFAFVGKTTKVIGINEHLHPFEQRMVVCHELAHQILRHPNSFYLCELNGWWYSRLELEAQRGAALILLPIRPLQALARRGWSVVELQNHFEVPGELVTLRLGMATRGL